MSIEPRATHARKEYEQGALDEATVAASPFGQFATWYDEAVAAGLPEPEAMTLSTATPDGRPSARVVLLRGFDEKGFCFFTNYESHKGRELAANPHAALTFHWAALERQVRIEGRERRLLREPAEHVTHRRLELAAEHGDPEPGGAREHVCPLSRRASRRRGDPAAGPLGWLPPRAGTDRVLAGAAEPAARSASLPAHRRWLDRGAAGAVSE